MNDFGTKSFLLLYLETVYDSAYSYLSKIIFCLDFSPLYLNFKGFVEMHRELECCFSFMTPRFDFNRSAYYQH